MSEAIFFRYPLSYYMSLHVSIRQRLTFFKVFAFVDIGVEKTESWKLHQVISAMYTFI